MIDSRQVKPSGEMACFDALTNAGIIREAIDIRRRCHELGMRPDKMILRIPLGRWRRALSEVDEEDRSCAPDFIVGFAVDVGE